MVSIFLWMDGLQISSFVSILDFGSFHVFYCISLKQNKLYSKSEILSFFSPKNLWFSLGSLIIHSSMEMHTVGAQT